MVCALAACGGASSVAPATPRSTIEQDRGRTSAFASLEEEQLGWLEAADPRIAVRTGRDPAAEFVEKVGTEGVLAEDPDGGVRGRALDLFGFRSRARVLERAARAIKTFAEPLPETGPLGAALARPKLEQVLLARLVDEERARVEDEAHLGDASADLVRGIVSTWSPPSAPQEWPERDAWVSKHLAQIRDSLRQPGAHVAPTSLDVALYPLERLLAPLQFPKGSAAIAEVRMALDADTRAVPRVSAPDRLAHDLKTHLGLTVDVSQLPQRLAALQQKLGALAAVAVPAGGDDRRAIEQRARELLMVESPCPAVPDSPVRAMAPPPERAAACGVLRALSEEEHQGAVFLALHDDVLLSLAAVVDAPPPRTQLLSHPADDVVDSLERMARERPVVALGAAFAAELVFQGRASPEVRVRAWRALGEAPLDVVAQELDAPPGAAVTSTAAR
jgi:hypothetical protein